MHHTNIVERCIHTWKNHFLLIKSGTLDTFRISNWCKMLEQCEITLNMMLPFKNNLNPSAFEDMEWMYPFDARTVYPVGTETPIRVKPVRCQSWRYHTMLGWYFSPALKHYCVIKIVIYTGAVILTETFKFKRHAIKTPTVNPAEILVKSTQALSLTIQAKMIHHQMN